MRIVKLDELQFLLCVKNQVWGSNRSNLKNWENGSLLLFKVDNQIAGLAKVNGDYFVSDEIVWDTGLYDNRRPIKFISIYLKKDRLNFDDAINKYLIDEWGKKYGYGILNSIRISVKNSTLIQNLIEKKPNSKNLIESQIELFIKTEERSREVEIQRSLSGTINTTDLKFRRKLIDL